PGVEKTALEAAVAEDNGDTTRAGDLWREVRQKSESESRTWGLLAEQKLQQLARADQSDKQLRQRLDEARALGQEFKPESEQEREAALATRAEQFGDLFLA